MFISPTDSSPSGKTCTSQAIALRDQKENLCAKNSLQNVTLFYTNRNWPSAGREDLGIKASMLQLSTPLFLQASSHFSAPVQKSNLLLATRGASEWEPSYFFSFFLAPDGQ